MKISKREKDARWLELQKTRIEERIYSGEVFDGRVFHNGQDPHTREKQKVYGEEIQEEFSKEESISKEEL